MRDGVQEGGREPRVAACLAALKAATAAAHAQIEAVPALSALMSEGVTLHDHGAVLQRFYIHFARFEPGLFACLGRGLPRAALLRRENTGPLRADLQDLGLPIPPVVAQPGPETLAEAADLGYAAVYAAETRRQEGLAAAPLVLGPGRETMWLWPGLTPRTFRRRLLAAGVFR